MWKMCKTPPLPLLNPCANPLQNFPQILPKRANLLPKMCKTTFSTVLRKTFPQFAHRLFRKFLHIFSTKSTLSELSHNVIIFQTKPVQPEHIKPTSKSKTRTQKNRTSRKPEQTSVLPINLLSQCCNLVSQSEI